MNCVSHAATLHQSRRHPTMAAAGTLPARALLLVVLALLGAAWHGSCAHDTDRPAHQVPSGGRPGSGASPLPANAPPTERSKAGAAPLDGRQPPGAGQQPGGSAEAAEPKTGAADPSACTGASDGAGVKCSCGSARDEGRCAGRLSPAAPNAPEGMSAAGSAKREVAKRGFAATCQLIGTGCPGAAITQPGDDANPASGGVGADEDESGNRSTRGQGQTPNSRSAAGRHRTPSCRTHLQVLCCSCGCALARARNCTATTAVVLTRRLSPNGRSNALR